MPNRLRRYLILLLAAVTLAAAPAVGVLAQSDSPAAVELPEPLAGWKEGLERLEKEIKETTVDDDRLIAARQEIQTLTAQAEQFVTSKAGELEAVNSQLAKLGPAPKPEDPPESEAAAQLRRDLSKQAAELDGAIKTVRVMNTQARQLIEEILRQRRAQFSLQLLKRSSSPLDPYLWQDVADATPGIAEGLHLLNVEWQEFGGRPLPVLIMLLIAAAATLALRRAALAAINRYRWGDARETPPLLRRAATAAGVTILRAAPYVAGALIFIGGLRFADQLPGRVGDLALSALVCFSMAMLVMALVKTTLAPHQPRWRIVPVSTEAARRLRWLAWGVLSLWALDSFLTELTRVLFLPLRVTVAQSLIISLLIATLLAAMVLTPLGTNERESPRTAGPGYLAIRLLLGVFVAVIFVSALLGYVALAKFLVGQIILTGSILALAALLHVTIEQLIDSIASPARREQPPDPAAQTNWYVRIGVIASLSLHLLLLAAAALLILLQWGLDWEDISNWANKAFFGFQFGNWTISISEILIAGIIFLTGLAITRVAQNWLETGVLNRARFDQGARSAIRTVIGYVGAALALIIAVSYAGMDFSNLALVAGALSVGIGFGLQSIVNNFVSGLILLAERRVSVGDWIIVGGFEGYVRNISVRATEIETFDRNFVIIPNSELISGAVTNWTFRNRRARVVVNVGVGYDSDPEQVQALLLECAREHPDVLEVPAPRCLFDDFGDSSLNFRLIGFVGDVDKGLKVRSELRMAVLAAFRKAGVEIPFPQRDVHLRDIDRIEKALAAGTPKPAPRRGTARKRGKSG